MFVYAGLLVNAGEFCYYKNKSHAGFFSGILVCSGAVVLDFLKGDKTVTIM